MKPVTPEVVLQQLRWRYATKKFDPARKISPDDWQTLEQALVLAPSSFGLQPWKFLVVVAPALRARLRAAAWNQTQVTDASHLVVLAARKEPGPADVERYVARIAEVRGVTIESLADYKKMMLSSLDRPPEQLAAWSARQVYLALGTFLTAAAMMGIDACPMEGFDPAQVDEVLGLGPQGYGAVVLAAAGYRAADDRYATLPKVRYAVEEVIKTVA